MLFVQPGELRSFQRQVVHQGPRCVAECPKGAIRLIPEEALGEAKRLNNVLSYAHMKEIEYMEKGERKTIQYAAIGKEELEES